MKGEKFLEVTLNTQALLGNFNPRSTWKIAVHQFECPLGQTRAINPHKNAQNADHTFAHIPQRQPRFGFFNDWLAPPGCLQYFTQPNGTVESFNLNNGVGKTEGGNCVQ
jgi:hypothetical protein